MCAEKEGLKNWKRFAANYFNQFLTQMSKKSDMNRWYSKVDLLSYKCFFFNTDYVLKHKHIWVNGYLFYI